MIVQPICCEMFDLVEDHDLWRHMLPESQAFAAGLSALNIEFDAQKNP